MNADFLASAQWRRLLPLSPRTSRIITATASVCDSVSRKRAQPRSATMKCWNCCFSGPFPAPTPRVWPRPLLKRFGTFGEVLGAPERLLREVPGCGAAVARDLKIVAAATQRMLRSEVTGRQILSSWSSVIDYCTAAMAYETKEQFRILFLDKRNVLIADEVQQTGTVDHTPVYPREVIKRALELSATALILVHNHPSGDPSPSRADIDMTKRIIDTAGPLGITVHDHVIIGKGSHASMKGLRLV